MKVITNGAGSGDWVVIKDLADRVIWSGHRVTPADLVDILNTMNIGAELVEVSDEEMEEM
jgi:hypothetical protein